MRILILGSLTIDYIDGEEKPGGPALFCSMACMALGYDYYCYGVIPRKYRWETPKGEFLEGEGPVFQHIYKGERRLSKLIGIPPRIGGEVVLEDYDLAIISPVFGEFEMSLLNNVVTHIPSAIDIQGFVRTADDKGNIKYKAANRETYGILQKARILHVSEDEYEVMENIPRGIIVVVTYGSRGCHIYLGEEKIYVPAYRVRGDPTGAGDFFTTILMAQYIVTGDILESTVYAAAATSIFIEGRLGRKVNNIRKLDLFRHELYRRIEKIRSGVRK